MLVLLLKPLSEVEVVKLVIEKDVKASEQSKIIDELISKGWTVSEEDSDDDLDDEEDETDDEEDDD